MILSSSFIFQLLIAMSSDFASSNGLTEESVNNAIVIHERGVARQQETSKKIFCKNLQWQVDWKSDEYGAVTNINIVYHHDGISRNLRDEAIELMSRAENLESISASCNSGAQATSVTSSLSLFATDKESGNYIVGQLEIDAKNSRGKWYFTPRE